MRLLFTFVAAGLLAAGAVAPGEEPLTITRHYTPADRERDRYVYVPFDVAEGTTGLQIKYAYDRAGGRNTIDLGVFEPGSLELHTTAMRGYSGGSKSEVTIGCESSPGYRPGPLPAGRWHVMFGLYEIAPAGVDVTLTVTTSAGAPCRTGGFVGSAGPSGFANPPRWIAGALHAHTNHSDGAAAPDEVFRRVLDAGLEFVAITDHNNTTHRLEMWRRLRPGHARPLWIIGEEVTTPAGHANVWGLRNNDWIDFRVRPAEGRVGELVEKTHRGDALFSINHPVGECSGCTWEHEVPARVDAIEVWNGRVGPQDGAVAIWERLLREGRRVTAVGASDWHRDPAPIDGAHVRVFAGGLIQSAILEGIKAGRVIVVRRATDATPSFTVRAGGRSATIGGELTIGAAPAMLEIEAPGPAGGRAVVVLNTTRIPVALDAAGKARIAQALEPGYIRLETYDASGEMVAFTNPVFLVK